MVVPGADRVAIAELHVPILEALRARSADDAVAAVRRHFALAGAMLGRLWDDETVPAGAIGRAAAQPIEGRAPGVDGPPARRPVGRSRPDQDAAGAAITSMNGSGSRP